MPTIAPTPNPRSPAPTAEPLPACAEAVSESEAIPNTIAATVTLMTLCISIYPLCDEGTSSLPLNTKVLVSSLLLSKLLKWPLERPCTKAKGHSAGRRERYCQAAHVTGEAARPQSIAHRNIRSNRKFRKSDGKALPNRLDRRPMPFFKPPANTLDRYKLELCADAFRKTWFEIAGCGRLPPSQEERLQTEVSAKLCSFASKGVIDPMVLQGLTVATVKFQRGTGRRLRLIGTPPPPIAR